MSKRKAERQITADDPEEEEVEYDPNETWKPAANTVIAGRRFVKAKRTNAPKTEVETPADTPATTEGTSENTVAKADPAALPSFTFKPIDTSFQGAADSTPQFSINWSSIVKSDDSTPKFTFASMTENKATEEKKPEVIEKTSEKSESNDQKSEIVEQAAKPVPDNEKSELTTPTIEYPSFSSFGSGSRMEIPDFGVRSVDSSDATKPSEVTTPSFDFKPSSTTPSAAEGEKTTESPKPIFNFTFDFNKKFEMPNMSGSVWGVDIKAPLEPVKTSESPISSAKVSLTPIEKHTTGEEDENTLYEVRGSLYEFVKEKEEKPAWKERGHGIIKVKEKVSDKKYRLLMRNENAIKIVLNANIFADMPIDKQGTSQVRFSCINVGSTKLSTFALKCPSPGDAEKLIEAIKNVKDKIKAAT